MEVFMLEAIDINFDFTTDTPHYWEDFKSGKNCKDPDIWSPTLRKYQQLLYSKNLPNGEMFKLEIGSTPNNYLYWKDFSFGSDSIINMYIHHKTLSWLINDVKKQINNFDKFYEDYLRKSYTIGGEIIFPKYPISINVERGRYNGKIKDRFDLTLECIRLFYNEEPSPLYKALKENHNFFELFVDFKGYVDFFYLNDLVSEDYNSINFYLDFDNFERNPRPQTVEEWFTLYNKQMEFLNARNARIHQSINNVLKYL